MVSVVVPLGVFVAGMWLAYRLGGRFRAERGISDRSAKEAMGFAVFMAAVLLMAAVMLRASTTGLFALGWLVAFALGFVVLRRRRRAGGSR